MLAYLGAAAMGLAIPAVIAIVKLFIDHAVLRSKHNGLQLEVNEFKSVKSTEFNELKREVKEDIKTNMGDMLKRFDRLETLLERLLFQEVRING
jgi:hypothetical protein